MKSIFRRVAIESVVAAIMLMHFSVSFAVLPSTIPFKAASESDDNLIFRAIAAFVFAGAVAYGIAWCVKRYMPSFEKKLGHDKQLERLESMRLTTRSVIVRVRWGNEELLLGESEHGVTLLGQRKFDGIVPAVLHASETIKAKDSHE